MVWGSGEEEGGCCYPGAAVPEAQNDASDFSALESETLPTSPHFGAVFRVPLFSG